MHKYQYINNYTTKKNIFKIYIKLMIQSIPKIKKWYIVIYYLLKQKKESVY